MKLSLTLSQVSLVLGLGCFLGHLWPVFRPASCAVWMRGFHRNTAVGVVLMLLGSVWFEQNLQNSEISDFAAFRPFLLGGVIAIGVASCFVVRDYLAVRGLAIVMCLVADLVLDAQRWHPEPLEISGDALDVRMGESGHLGSRFTLAGEGLAGLVRAIGGSGASVGCFRCRLGSPDFRIGGHGLPLMALSRFKDAPSDAVPR